MTTDPTNEQHTPHSSRRRMLAGMAWTTPVVAASLAAPAYAASCLPTSVTTPWTSSNYRRNSSTSGTYTVPDPDGSGRGTGMTVDVNSVFGSNTKPGTQTTNEDTNLRARAGTVGGSITGALEVHQAPIYNTYKTGYASTMNSQTITFRFSKPVTGLTFTITDIDSYAYDYIDYVTVSGGAYTTRVRDSTYLNPSGGAVRPISTNAPLDDGASSRGNATYTFSGEVTSVTIRYYNTTAAYDPYIDGDQGIYISPFAFTYNPC